MKAMNSSLIYRPYYKTKETSQVGYQEANTQTKMHGWLMKNMIRKNITGKYNNKKVSYHFVSTQ